MRRTIALLGAAATVVVGAGVLGACGSSAPAGPRVTVMTRNLDEGTDFGPLVHATSAGAFLSAAAATWQEVQASDIPGRAAAVAAEIVAAKPDLVSIEEASIWRTGPLLKGPATTVVYDALASLQRALDDTGSGYRTVVVQQEADLEGPSSLGYDIRVTDEDAILARSALSLSNVRSGHFSHVLTLTPVGVKETILRGWTSVDARIGGKSVHYVETHLESFDNAVQKAQAQELVAGPARSNLPVIVACDCNTGPRVTPTYGYLVGAGGLHDAWTATNSGAGLTWPLHKEDPYGASATPNQRIDLVLFKGGVSAVSARLVGTGPGDRTAAGLWPSDHAGVVATLALTS
ncbi:MAG TPA: endonuclease/exonuclease/phosphatase family protein [Acidimicrobiales bacterium]|nr:endonuclease/exonuclease/phosphatase family protein [Acidimicrobiales bacterium]